MAQVIIPSEQTNITRVERFLDLTGDFNPIHRGDQRIMPGMFYLALAAPYLVAPIKAMQLKFKGIANYPFEINLDEQTEDRRKRLLFSQNGRPLCEAEFQLEDRVLEEATLIEHSRIADFSDTIGAYNPFNTRKLWLASLIPGKLMKHYGALGIYVQQKMHFKQDTESVDPRLDINLRAHKKNLLFLTTDYLDCEYDTLAAGEAIVASL
jgi:hypothetical protein